MHFLNQIFDVWYVFLHLNHTWFGACSVLTPHAHMHGAFIEQQGSTALVAVTWLQTWSGLILYILKGQLLLYVDYISIKMFFQKLFLQACSSQCLFLPRICIKAVLLKWVLEMGFDQSVVKFKRGKVSHKPVVFINFGNMCGRVRMCMFVFSCVSITHSLCAS